MISIVSSKHCAGLRSAVGSEQLEVPGSILGPVHTFMETDHKIFSTVISTLPLIQEEQLSVFGQVHVWALSTGSPLRSKPGQE